MANTKISQLPLWSGTAADLRWFVMNNSGETETYKFSGYSSPYKYTNSTFSSNNTYDTNPLSGSYNKIIGGENHSVQGNYNAIVGGYGHNFANIYSGNLFVGGGLSHTFEGGDRTASIGGYANYFYGGEQNYGVGGQSNQIFIANNSGIIGGESCSVYTGFGTKHNGIFNGAYNKIINDAKNYNTIINGEYNVISGASSYYNTIIGGSQNGIDDGVGSVIIGGIYNKNNSGGYNFLGGGYGNIISGGTNYSSILGGQFNTNVGNYSSIVAGRYNNILSAATEYSTIIGSYSSTTGGDYSHIFGGVNHRIDSPQAVIVGGLDNYIGPQSDNSEIIGSRNSVISGQSQDTTLINTIDTNSNGYDRVVMLGTSGRTASADNTTHVENLHIYRTPSTTVQPISSGTTFTCDLNNGGKAQYYITGTSTVNITNVRDGQSFMIKTQTDGNYVMTWTATGGYTFVFEGGIKDPGNNVTDIFDFDVFGTTIYGSRRHNFS